VFAACVEKRSQLHLTETEQAEIRSARPFVWHWPQGQSI
jgi:hypothetical protein